MTTVGIVSLGCPKNQSDSEVLIGRLLEAGMNLTADPREADAVVVNTCSFILDAREESLEAISEMAKEAKRRRKSAKPLKIIVAGCMPQRYGEKIREMIPQADAFIGIDELGKIAPLVEKLCAGKPLSKDGLAPVAVTKRPRSLKPTAARSPRRYRRRPRMLSQVRKRDRS